MDKQLHIVTHEVPWPPDFGGVIDLFYKIKALQQFGIKIKLHCFTNKRSPNKILDKYCESVHYYPRRKGLSALSLKLPYIVQSRISEELLARLSADQLPILFEGIHSSFYLNQLSTAHRKIFLRVHNVEHLYYQRLAKHEPNPLKKMYYLIESRLLRNYEAETIRNTISLPVSSRDEDYLRTVYDAGSVHWLPVFTPWDSVVSESGTGAYCLYHGNLAINENDKAARWLIQKVFHNTEVSFVIAGYAPSAQLQSLCGKVKNVKLVSDPSDAELLLLVKNAHVNVLPSFNTTGVKLKLLNALYNGRHCVANTDTVSGAAVDECCVIAETAEDFKRKITELMSRPFTTGDIRRRNEVLQNSYNWEKNAKKLIAWIY